MYHENRKMSNTYSDFQFSGSFNFKKLLGFTSFFNDPVRLGNRTYRVWGENSIEKWTIE